VTFGEPPRTVPARLGGQEVATETVRVRTRPGARIPLWLSGAAVLTTTVVVPDPVPARLELRVPARDDPRLAAPVLQVVDAGTGAPLPGAYLDPGTAAPEGASLHADAEGRIRVPAVLAARLRQRRSRMRAAIVGERDHLPRGWLSLARMGSVSAADWTAWDASGAMRVALEPLGEPPVPRRTLRVLGEDGKPRSGCLVLVRTMGTDVSAAPPWPARTDASGRVEVIAPRVAACDVYDGTVLVGSFVIARDARPDDAVGEIRVPTTVRVHVVVRGLARPHPDAWLGGPDVVPLEADEPTGWARLDGVTRPGWRAFRRAPAERVRFRDGRPAEADLVLPRATPVPLDVAGRRAVLRAEETTTIEIDWGALGPVPQPPGNVRWSATREGLDAPPRGGPAAPAGPR
jgi:hypothetical protein